MTRFDLQALGTSAAQHSGLIEQLNQGGRFVVTVPTLAVHEETHQTVVTIVDLSQARVVVGNGESMMLFMLMDAAQVDFAITCEGSCLVEFMSWLAASFCRQYTGIIETDGDPDMVEVRRMTESKDGPDLVFWTGPSYTSLLVFDPFDCIYRVVETWILGFNTFVPDSLDSALDSVTDTKLYAYLVGLRQASEEEKAAWFTKVCRHLSA